MRLRAVQHTRRSLRELLGAGSTRPLPSYSIYRSRHVGQTRTTRRCALVYPAPGSDVDWHADLDHWIAGRIGISDPLLLPAKELQLLRCRPMDAQARTSNTW
jgi:hypothetical protein